MSGIKTSTTAFQAQHEEFRNTFCKGQLGNVFSFAGHMVCFTTTKFYLHSKKAAIHSLLVSKHEGLCPKKTLFWFANPLTNIII